MFPKALMGNMNIDQQVSYHLLTYQASEPGGPAIHVCHRQQLEGIGAIPIEISYGAPWGDSRCVP